MANSDLVFWLLAVPLGVFLWVMVLFLIVMIIHFFLTELVKKDKLKSGCKKGF